MKFSSNLQQLSSLFPQIILPFPQYSNMLNQLVLFHRSLMLDTVFKKLFLSETTDMQTSRNICFICLTNICLSSVLPVYGGKVNLSSVTPLRQNTEVLYFSYDLLLHLTESPFSKPSFPQIDLYFKGYKGLTASPL